MVAEPDSERLVSALRSWPRVISSGLLATEARRAALRTGGDDLTAVERALESVTLLPVSDELLREAGLIGPPLLRSLDALHLATALSLGDDIGILFSYDARLAEAAAEAGLRVEAPSVDSGSAAS